MKFKASELTFGIEVECYVKKNSNTFRQGSYHNGLQVHNGPKGWNTQTDSSLQGTPRGYKAIEVVSPILKSETGLFEIWKVADMLHEESITVDKYCGIHVHVGLGKGKSFTPQQALKIANAYQEHEIAFYSINGTQAKHRYNHIYCQNSTKWTPSTNFSERRRSVNLTHVGRGKGTIEFRLFASTISHETMISAVYMVLGFVTAVLNDTLKSLPQPDSLSQPNANDFMYRFIRSVFGRKDNRIIPDEKMADVFRHLISRSREMSIVQP